jgi:hypothetical protein
LVSFATDSVVEQAAQCSAAMMSQVGSLPHVPNQQAIHHLLEDVLPHIKRLLPVTDVAAFKVHIVGGTATIPLAVQPLFDKHKADIVFHGWLSKDQSHHKGLRAFMIP